MRLFVSVIATAIFFAASAASAAVTFTVDTSVASGNALDALVVGDIVTLDITMRSDGLEPVFAIGGAVSGGAGAVNLVSGSTVPSALVSVCIPGGCFGGLDSSQAVSLQAAGDIQFFNGVSISGSSQTGAMDPGFDGVVGSPQAQVVLEVLASTTLTVGALAAFGDAIVGQGGAFLTSNNATIELAIIPEPGTALLMGLGLAGLAGAGRRNA